jgi:hypothetical protein
LGGKEETKRTVEGRARKSHALLDLEIQRGAILVAAFTTLANTDLQCLFEIFFRTSAAFQMGWTS